MKKKRNEPAQSTRTQHVTRHYIAFSVLVIALLLAAVAWVIRSRKAGNQLTPAASSAEASFEPTTVSTAPAPGAAPEAMVWIPGGEFSMGANDPPDMDEVGMKATLDSRP